MRQAVLALATAAVLAAPVAAQTQWANKLFDETSKDFGTCPRGAQLKHSFKMTNIYKVPLDITLVDVRCGCVTYTLSHKTLGPNETGYLHVVMDAARFSGHKSVNIYVTVGPQFVSMATLTVQAVARQDVAFNPGAVNFGVVGRGQSPTQSIEVEYAGSLEWRLVEIVKNAAAPFQVTAEEMYRQPPSPARGLFGKPQPGRVGYRISCTLKADAAAGSFKQELILKTNDPASPVFAVVVDGKVQASLEVAPQVVNMGMLKLGEKNTQRVFVRGSRAFKITGVEGDGKGGLTVEHSTEARESQIVTIHFQPIEAGEVRRQLRFRTDLDNETATVTVEGTVQGTSTTNETPQ